MKYFNGEGLFLSAINPVCLIRKLKEGDRVFATGKLNQAKKIPPIHSMRVVQGRCGHPQAETVQDLV